MVNIFSSKSQFVQPNVVCPVPAVPAVPTFWTPATNHPSPKAHIEATRINFGHDTSKDEPPKLLIPEPVKAPTPEPEQSLTTEPVKAPESESQTLPTPEPVEVPAQFSSSNEFKPSVDAEATSKDISSDVEVIEFSAEDNKKMAEEASGGASGLRDILDDK